MNVGDINTHLQTFAQSLSSDNKTMGTIASTMLVVANGSWPLQSTQVPVRTVSM